MKILAFTPAHPDYGLRPQTWDSVRAAIDAYDGAIDWMVSHGDNPHDEPFDNIAAAHNKARAVALELDYDAMLSIEADMVVPPHTVQGLIEADADIAYGLYVWRHRLKRWNAYYHVELFGGYSLTLDPDRARQAWGEIVDVKGLGMGCTLIRRNVLERLEFRLYDGRDDWIVQEYGEKLRRNGFDPYRPRNGMFADDWLLALEAEHFGFTQRANLGVVCGHVDGDSVIWPHPAAGDLYYTEAANGVHDA